MNNKYEFDYLIIGSGAAGLFAASKLAAHGKVAVVNKGEFSESSTWYAQGGIAGVMDASDSIENHIADTIKAGSGLCHEDTVRNIIGRGTRIIGELISFGTAFDSDNGVLHLTHEAAHSHRRIAHAKDATGKALGEALLAPVSNNPNITAFQRHMAVDVITARHLGRYKQGADRCLGAYVLSPDGEVITIAARKRIVTGITRQDIVASVADNGVIEASSGNVVDARGPAQGLVDGVNRQLRRIRLTVCIG